MSTYLRYDQCCAEDNCLRPARHAGLCVMHYLAAPPAVRATADLLDRLDAERVREHLELLADALTPTAIREVRELESIFQQTSEWDSLEVAQCCALEAMWDAPAYREAA